jgi:tetratricopeptide (TPR) repeat protein
MWAFLLGAVLLAAAGNHPTKRSLTDNAEWITQSTAGATALRDGNTILAEEKYREALKITLSYELEDPGHAAETGWSLGQVELTLGKKDKAEGLFDHSLTLAERSQDDSESLLGEHFRFMGNFYMQEGKAKKAAKVYARALDHDQTAEQGNRDADWRVLTLDRVSLGDSLVQSKDFAGAQPLFEAALQACAKAQPAVDEDRHLCQRGQLGKANVLAGQKQIPEASALYQQLLDDHVDGACAPYAKLLRARKMAKQADALGCQ